MKGCFIASCYAPTYLGGLAAYQRCLAEALGSDGGAFLAEKTHFPRLPPDERPLPWPLWRMEPNALHRLSSPFWPRLASRRIWFSSLLALTQRSWSFPCDLPSPRVVHLVDTGWHFCGFAVERWARRHGACVTIWPAVHPGQWGDDRVDLELYRRADTVFCQSRGEMAHLVERGLDPGKAVLCGLPPMGGVAGEAGRFRARHRLGDRPVVFFLGSQTAGKGYPALVQAWSRVLEAIPEAVLVIAGAFAEFGEFGKNGPEAALPPDAVRNLGPIDEEEKADAFAACTLFCLPSAHESFGIVYVEAWSYGKPVICGPAPASRELVCDGETGLWANQNPDALAERLLHLLQDETLARRMGEAGLALQKREYTREVMLETHLRVWERLTRAGALTSLPPEG